MSTAGAPEVHHGRADTSLCCASWAVQTLAAGVLATREGVDALFGAGTAAGLGTAVAAVGADLESLAAGVHGVVAGGVAGAAGLVDGVAGQGATASAANGLRQQAQLGVESIESAGEWAAGVWRTLTGGAESLAAGGGGARV